MQKPIREMKHNGVEAVPVRDGQGVDAIGSIIKTSASLENLVDVDVPFLQSPENAAPGRNPVLLEDGFLHSVVNGPGY